MHQPGKSIFTVACVCPCSFTHNCFLIRTWWLWCTRLWRENSLGYPITSTTVLESSSEGENSLGYPITSTTILESSSEGENSLGYPITSTTVLESSSEGENSLGYPITSTTIHYRDVQTTCHCCHSSLLQNSCLRISIALISIFLPCTV